MKNATIVREEPQFFQMYILNFNFKLLTLAGCWRPNSCSSLHKRTAYNAYSFLIFVTLSSFFLSQAMYLALKVKSVEDFSDNFYMLIAIFISCCKLFNLLINRKNIIMLLAILTRKPCRPLQQSEMKIQYKFNKNIETNTLRFFCLGMMTCTMIALTSLWFNFGKRKLTYRGWLPYNYSTTVLYSLTFTHQLISLTIGGCINIGCDTLICGFLAHLCSQIEILAYRLRKNISHSDTLGECVRHHYYIFRMAVVINIKFRLIITIQFILSTIMICLSFYRLTKMTSQAKHVEMIMYIVSTLTQIFFYCWYGNDVKIKSSELIDNIFMMEWITLDEDTKKSLLLIMRRSIVPIQITSAYIIPMNLEAFMSILKTSYSTYSLLQQM